MAYIKRGFKEIIWRKQLLFDLDGTLTDSQEGILKSIKFALEHFGYDVPDEETLQLFFRTTIGRCFSRALWHDLWPSGRNVL